MSAPWTRLPFRHLLAFLLLAGCPSKATEESGLACGDVSEALTLSDENNYLFAGSLDLRSFPLAAPGNPLLDWSGLERDLLGHALDPATEILTVGVAVFEDLGQEDVEEALSSDSLAMSDVRVYVSTHPGGETSLHLGDLTLLGNDIDIETDFLEGTGTWLLVLSDSLLPGVGARMAAFLEPRADASETVAALDEDAALLSLEVDLEDLVALDVPTGRAELSVDWAGLETNGRGGAWKGDSVDRVMVARFAGMDLTAMEADFLDLEIDAADLWNLDFVGGSHVDLAPLADAEPPFEGIDAEGIWALALFCSTCSNPAPPFFTVMRACP
jgi:hypothetical protein